MSEIDMILFLLNAFLLMGLAVSTAPDVMILDSSSVRRAEADIKPKKCLYSKVYSMLQVMCLDIGLEQVPSNLNTDIQILDASYNRLRELDNDSLSRYTKLAYIYLGDNFIQNIEESAFAQQHYLEVLDLTKNGCDNLPKNLFRLPYLRKVYLANNKFTDSVFKVQVESPISLLQLSKNKLTTLPEMGAVPSLLYLNLSENLIGKATAQKLASFCQLKVLDLSKNPISFDKKNCECESLNAWLKEREIVYKPLFNCTQPQPEQCVNVQFSNKTLSLYEECMNVQRLREEAEKARYMWILVASCVSAFIVVLFLMLYCIHKRNRKGRKKMKKEQQTLTSKLTSNNANAQLLNSNLQTPSK